MKKLKWMAMLVMIAALSVNANAQPQRVGDFTLLDHKGTAHQLTRQGYLDAVVLIGHAVGCQVNHEEVAPYKVLRTNYGWQNVGFYMINPMDHRDEIRADDAVWNFDFPILIDRTQLVAQDLGMLHAGEIVILDPTRRLMLYRGPLQGNIPRTSEIRNVLNQIAEGVDTRDIEPVIVEHEYDASCAYSFPVADKFRDSPPDYVTDVAPILIERCVGCHIDGGIGPFAMNSHMMIQGWSPMIRETVMTGRMPPMQVDPDIREWRNSGNMTIEETQTLIHWIDAGAPRE